MKDIAINPLPALTWNWLHINDAPFNTAATPVRMTPEITGRTDGISISESATAENAALAHIETSAGKNCDSLFEHALPLAITVDAHCTVAEPLVLTFDVTERPATVSTQVIRAHAGARVTVIIITKSAAATGGFQAQRTYCIAEKDAAIHLIKVQLLGDDFRQLDDTGVLCDERASVRFTQVTLGARQTYTGAAARIAGLQSSFYADTAYVARNNQSLDMNYLVRQAGQKSDCLMRVKGTLSDNAHKTYRGSIDFIPGCTGANGEEQEETLLLSPTATNKSIPLILCGEDDISGEHGATIGRLNDDLLFYLPARGIGRKAAEAMHARAKVQSVAALIPHEPTVALITAYLDGVYGSDA